MTAPPSRIALAALGAPLAAALCLAALALAAASSQASAAEPQTIAGPGTGAGRVDNPAGVAVDEAGGYLYVADRGNRRVDKFDVEGHFLMAWGFGVRDTAIEPQTCGPEAVPPTIKCFKVPQPEYGTYVLDENDEPGNVRPEAVAVDGEGDVYVADSSKRRLTKFSPEGEFLWMAGKDVDPSGATQGERDLCSAEDVLGGDECGAGQSGAGAGEFFAAGPRAVAVDSAGRIWALDGNAANPARAVELDPSGHHLAEAPLAAAAVGAFPRGLAVDAAGDLYTVRPGIDERQEVEFSGFSPGDTFTLGNLPAACASGGTAAIEYTTEKSGLVLQARLEEALRESCGPNLAVFLRMITFLGAFATQDYAQLSCTRLSGEGSCAVGPSIEGAPGTVEKLDSSGAALGTVYSGAPEALALDPEGNLYVGDRRGYQVKRFNAAGEQSSQFGAGQVIGLPRGARWRSTGRAGRSLRRATNPAKRPPFSASPCPPRGR